MSDVVFWYTAAASCDEVMMYSFWPATVIANGSRVFPKYILDVYQLRCALDWTFRDDGFQRMEYGTVHV